MAWTGGGRKGWPLPPPPLKEGVDRRAFRQAKDWTIRHHQRLVEQQCSYQIYHQDQELGSSLVNQRCQDYSEELKTVIRTSPLKWNVLPRRIDNVQLLGNVAEECEEEKKVALEGELDGDDKGIIAHNLSLNKKYDYHFRDRNIKTPQPNVVISHTENEEILSIEVTEEGSTERSGSSIWCCNAFSATTGDQGCRLTKQEIADDVDVEGK